MDDFRAWRGGRRRHARHDGRGGRASGSQPPCPVPALLVAGGAAAGVARARRPRLDLAGSITPVLEAPDAVAALDGFAAHLARYHSQIRSVDLALLGAKEDDADVAALVEHGMQLWLEGSRSIAQRLDDVGLLAAPWTLETAADLLWSFMFPETLDRLTIGRGWAIDRYQQLLTVPLRRTLIGP